MGHIAHVLKIINVYKILVRKIRRKETLRRPKHRWKNIINMDVKERVCGLDSSGAE